MAIADNSHTKDLNLKDPGRFFNRELSWLGFNERVLAEADNPAHPLLERVKFLAISASNLEEFFMVRVAGLVGQIENRVQVVSLDGRSPQQQLKEVMAKALELSHNQNTTWLKLQHHLADESIMVVRPDDLPDADQDWLTEFFDTQVMPVLSPLAVDQAHPFPFVRNLGYGMALKMRAIEDKKDLNGLVIVPDQLAGFVELPSNGEQIRYIAMRDVIQHHLHLLYPSFKITSTGYFQVVRDSELEVEEEAEDLVRLFETALKRRQRGEVIHLMYDASMSGDLLDFLIEEFELEPEFTSPMEHFIRLTKLFQFGGVDRSELKFEPFEARYPERIRDFEGDCFAAIKAKDFVVHHPFESFDVVVRFIRQAANDPNVLSIKQTLYRTSNNSPIVKALCDAAEGGKSVTAMVELKARFDEAANIRWARDLERAGVQVVYGFVDLKTHAKISLITRKEQGKLVSYAHFGTGNYHPSTAKIYTDLSFFTADARLTRDANILFNYMTSYGKPVAMEKLIAAPIGLRSTLIDHINQEIAHAEAGKSPEIWFKMNSLVDPKTIDALYRASQAGVKIQLSIRGICCLRPGIEGLSENIRVISIIGRFLEHSRVYAFSNGIAMESKKATLYISSADLMPRNLDRRVETLVPIENTTVKQQILGQIMRANFKEELGAWELDANGGYNRVQPVGDDLAFSSHSYFMNNPSLSGRGSALKKA